MKTWHYLALAAVGLLLLSRRRRPDMVITEEEVAQWEAEHPEYGPPLPDDYDPNADPLT